jgi:hypothetical protein
VRVPKDETACNLEGWAIDTDPKGLNVRAAPSPQAAVLGTLPPYVTSTENFGFGVEFKITASHNGWLRIEGAKDDPGRSGKPLRPAYSGTGWVHGSRVGFGIQSGSGHARPDTASQQLLNLGDDGLTEMGKIRLIVACDKDWALVDFSLERRRDSKTQALEDLSPAQQEASRGRAWFRNICASQEATCDQ